MARRITVDSKRIPVTLRLDGAALRAYQGDSVATVAVAHNLPTMRSLKYHRPRGPFCMDGHCGSCLMRIDGEPNVRACMTRVREGMEIQSQNAAPTAACDALAVIDRVFASGLDHHTIMTGSKIQNRLAQVVVRQLSGQGTLPNIAEAYPALPASRIVCDVLVVGGGVAGRAAAASCAAHGIDVVLLDDQVDVSNGQARGETGAGYRALRETACIGVFREHGEAYAIASAPAQTYRIEPRVWIWATGSHAQNAVFPGNDRPHVFAARAAERLLASDVLVGDNVLIATDEHCITQASALGAALHAAGAHARIVPVEALSSEEMQRDVDAICLAIQRSPAFEAPKQLGCDVAWQPDRGGFVVVTDGSQQTSVAGAFACGDVAGCVDEATAAAQGVRAGAAAAACIKLDTRPNASLRVSPHAGSETRRDG